MEGAEIDDGDNSKGLDRLHTCCIWLRTAVKNRADTMEIGYVWISERNCPLRGAFIRKDVGSWQQAHSQNCGTECVAGRLKDHTYKAAPSSEKTQ